MRTRRKFIIITATALWAAGCANSAPKSGAKTEGGSEDESSGDSSGISLSSDADLSGWCKKAGETEAAEKLSEIFGDLCNGSKPTSLFKSGLMGVLYSGSGEPKLKSIEALDSDKASKTTTYKFGVAIKLPISIEKHFDEVGPRGGDEEAQQDLAEANGADAEVEVKKTYKNDGEHHVRGWLIYAKNTKKTGAVKITTETETRSDQFELEKDQHYMYTQNTVEGIQTIKKFDMVTAGIQDGNTSYLLTVVDIAVANKGFASEAEKQLKSTAKETIKAMYKAAEEAK